MIGLMYLNRLMHRWVAWKADDLVDFEEDVSQAMPAVQCAKDET